MRAAVVLDASAASAQHAAAAILSERRFHNPAVARPLHGLLHAIGGALTSAARAIAHLVGALGAGLPGGAITVWIVLAATLLAGALLITSRYSHRVLLGQATALGPDDPAALERPTALERAADQAEREGRLSDAVRLRFRAGLGRLQERGAIDEGRSARISEVVRILRSPTFDVLARRFDEIAYGEADAAPADVEQARREWPVVLRKAARR